MRLCIPILAESTAEAMEKMQRSSPASDGSEVILELRVDRIRDLDLEALLGRRRGGVLVTNRRKEEGGFFRGSEEARVGVLRHAVALGADCVDIEASSDSGLISGLRREIESRGGSTMLIVSTHDFRKTPAEACLRQRLAQCEAWAPDIVKIVTMAQSVEDNLRVLRLIPRARRKGLEIIAFCMGRRGRISRIVSPIMGAYLAFAAARRREASAPGQMTVKEMVRIFGVLGVGREQVP